VEVDAISVNDIGALSLVFESIGGQRRNGMLEAKGIREQKKKRCREDSLPTLPKTRAYFTDATNRHRWRYNVTQ
jgi:hypothetical protein